MKSVFPIQICTGPMREVLYYMCMPRYYIGIGIEDHSRIQSFCNHNSSLEGAIKLKPVPFCSPSEPISDEIIDGCCPNFQILAKNHGL